MTCDMWHTWISRRMIECEARDWDIRTKHEYFTYWGPVLEPISTDGTTRMGWKWCEKASQTRKNNNFSHFAPNLGFLWICDTRPSWMRSLRHVTRGSFTNTNALPVTWDIRSDWNGTVVLKVNETYLVLIKMSNRCIQTSKGCGDGDSKKQKSCCTATWLLHGLHGSGAIEPAKHVLEMYPLLEILTPKPQKSVGYSISVIFNGIRWYPAY